MSVKKNGMKIIVFTVIIIVLAVGFLLSHFSSSQEILEGIVDTDEINIASKVTGRIDELHVKEGDNIHNKQLIVSLFDKQTTESARQAKENLEAAIASQEKAHNGERSEYIESLKASWISAQADEKNVKMLSDRIINLYDNSRAVSAQERDDAVAKYNIARQKTNSAYEQYMQAKRGNREEDIRIADANVNAAKAAFDSAQSLVNELSVTAKNNGQISKRFANEGELVSAGTPIYSMVDLNNLWVTVNLREDRFNALKIGDTIEGSIPALKNRNVKFKVFFINPKANFATWRATRQSSGYDVRTFEVRLRSEENVEGMRPGMSVIFDWPVNHDAK
ncbi:efflux RND transporter periplasmic adaptor subunit [Citrobacter sp. JGM124]|uniref:HlyD family secretion protein n=1 Tax=Citrobacter sp. JGM124 TaxID=2799789 RepID=UPI0020137208|nr:efflux RND transporter periplasmic adaptor subunit [Citrobacter sp. JGM124]